MNLQHGLHAGFRGKHIAGRVGAANEKKLFMKFFLEKSSF